MRKLRILLGDLGYFNQYSRNSTYVPLNIGYVAQYCLQCFPGEVDIQLFKEPEKLMEAALASKPDVIGLSFYYWNAGLNHSVVRHLRTHYGSELTVIWGGPSVGTDRMELQGIFRRFPEVDAFVINEGELGFANTIANLLSNGGDPWSKPIDGAVFQSDGKMILGKPVGLTLDLGTLPSPYLNGLLDQFLVGEYIPMLQTSRLCPYTCSFCTSGKNRGKLRAFPIEQVKAEIDMICDRFADRPYMGMLLSDENFGILSRDVKLAEYISKAKERTGYPKSIFFYNDKQFTQTSKQVIEALGQINTHGLILSLQSENPETLKEVKRRNLSPKDIAAALKWASDRNMPTSTELIFGLPYETKESFLKLLSSCVEKGFDSILGFNLFLMDGIELNTPGKRKQHGIRTMFRPVGTYYGVFEDEFTAETEEIVVETKYFTFEDFMLIRSLNFVYYAVFALGFYKWFFQFIRHCNIDISEFMLTFISPNHDDGDISSRHRKFCSDFRNAIEGELFLTREAAQSYLQVLYESNGEHVCEPVRQNVYYGARLAYLENDWIEGALVAMLRKSRSTEANHELLATARFVLKLCEKERVNLLADNIIIPEPMMTTFDVVSWKADKFSKPIENYRIKPGWIHFSLSEDTRERIKSFQREFGGMNLTVGGYYYEAMDFMNRRELLFKIELQDDR